MLDVLLGAGDFTEIDTQIDYFRQISQADEDTVARHRGAHPEQ